MKSGECRCRSPANPAGMAGQELTLSPYPGRNILKVQETIRAEAASELYIELDNTGKGYFHGYGSAINKGYLVRLKYGYAGRGGTL